MPSTLGRTCVLALGASALLVACKPKDAAYVDTNTAAGAVAPTDSMAMGNKSWSDPQILGFAWAANSGEVAEGKLAATKATNPQVKAYARQLVTDHEKLLSDTKAYLAKNNVTPDTTRDEIRDFLKDGNDELKELNEKAAGADWDKEFIDKEIDGHKKVLERLQDAEKATADPALKDALTKAAGKVQEHLTKAEGIKENVLKS